MELLLFLYAIVAAVCFPVVAVFVFLAWHRTRRLEQLH